MFDGFDLNKIFFLKWCHGNITQYTVCDKCLNRPREKTTHDHWIFSFLESFFFLEEIRVCNSLQKRLSFSSVGWIYLLVKRIECIPRSTRLLRLFFRSLSFSCHFSDFFGKIDKRMDNVISQHRRTLNVCRKPTKTHDKSTMSVILETSLGEITVDLFTDERPRC